MRASRAALAQRKDALLLGGIPVEYKGGTVPPPDQRRSYS
jgi:NADH-quinone oxidoreductase subunit C